MTDNDEQSIPSRGYADNTDRELWRERPGECFSDNIFVTESGAIGISVKGYVLVANVRAWHSAGVRMLTVDETLPQWRRRLGMWLLGWA
jgi:hypothetical protein